MGLLPVFDSKSSLPRLKTAANLAYTLPAALIGGNGRCIPEFGGTATTLRFFVPSAQLAGE
jgi:hypothetical protein